MGGVLNGGFELESHVDKACPRWFVVPLFGDAEKAYLLVHGSCGQRSDALRLLDAYDTNDSATEGWGRFVHVPFRREWAGRTVDSFTSAYRGDGLWFRMFPEMIWVDRRRMVGGPARIRVRSKARQTWDDWAGVPVRGCLIPRASGDR